MVKVNLKSVNVHVPKGSEYEPSLQLKKAKKKGKPASTEKVVKNLL